MAKGNLLVAIGKQIRTMREDAGYSQENFSHVAGMGRSYYGRIERGEQNISMDILMRLCLAFKCNPQCLLPDYFTIKKLWNKNED